MTEDAVIGIGQRAIIVALELAAPALLMALIVGVAVSVLQAVTQIQEMTLAFVPKILAVVAAIVFFGPWMMRVLVEYTRGLLMALPNYVP